MMQSNNRNRTGAFLAMETMSGGKQASCSAKWNTPKIPPLQMGRGRLTRTSAEINRHRKVQAIREQETYKGFSGITLNAAQRPRTSPAACHKMRKSRQMNGAPSDEDIIQLTRPNPRRFTAVNNRGVTHREYLTYDTPRIQQRAPPEAPVDLATSLAQTAAVQGPTQYYNTLCKNNPEALKTLLNNKKFGWPTNQYTGFHVRSYRKPAAVRIITELDSTTGSTGVISPRSRPKTAASAALLASRELLVPQPFIYRSSANATRRVAFRSAPPSALHQKQEPIRFADDVAGMFNSGESKLNTSAELNEDVTVPTEVNGGGHNTPDTSLTSNLIGRLDKAMPIMKKTLATKEPLNPTTNDNVPSTQLNNQTNSKKIPFKPQISIAIETDDGDLQPLEIDDVEEVFQDDGVYNSQSANNEEPLVRRHSISERIQKIKIGEDAAKSLQIEAQQRKQVLQNLLEEHEHIVRQIVSVDSKENTH